MPLFEKKNVSRRQKLFRKVTKFIIRDTAQCMGEHTGKQFVYLTQKQGRDTHSERKGMGILSNEEEPIKSDTRQRYTPREE